MALRGRAGTISTPESRCVLPTWPLSQSRISSALCAAAGFQHDECHGRLSPPIRGDAHHGGFGDGLVAGEDGFQIARVDVEPAGDDHVLLAIHQDEKAVGIEPADVAAADETLAARVVPFRLGGPLGALVVSVHDPGRVPDDLADLARRHFLAGLVDEANVVVRRRLADGVKLVGMEMGGQHASAAALGQAVVLGETAGPALQDVGLDAGRERRARRQLHDEAREVVAVEIRHGHDAPVLHRHQHGVRGAVPFRQLQKAVRVELLHQHGGAAVAERGQEAHQRRVRIKRRRDDRHRCGAIAVGWRRASAAASASHTNARCPWARPSFPTNR